MSARCSTPAIVAITVATFSVLLAAAGALYAWSGLYDVSASSPDNPLVAWALHGTYEASLHRHAGRDTPPADLMSLANIRAGAQLYESTCAVCHGAPGRDPSPIASGLRPAPPALLAATRRNKPVLMFWAIKHGVNMTAMPAFGNTQSDERIWQAAAFLFHARGISPQAYAALTGESESKTAPQPH
ncbi:MAG TPA: cytochrome c [Paraburkholderia sp.]|jgi:mono/diheme cytochrome c family protein|nr:cytochrome c [Paraburkholderia sp.]